jgi:hypothetical protein
VAGEPLIRAQQAPSVVVADSPPTWRARPAGRLEVRKTADLSLWGFVAPRSRQAGRTLNDPRLRGPEVRSKAGGRRSVTDRDQRLVLQSTYERFRADGGIGRSGAACLRVRCGRWVL